MLAACYRAPHSVRRICSTLTCGGHLRSAPTNLAKFAPPGLARPPRRGSEADTEAAATPAQRLIEALRSATPMRTWQAELPALLLGHQAAQASEAAAASAAARDDLLSVLEDIVANGSPAERSAAEWYLQILRDDDADPRTGWWLLWDAIGGALSPGGADKLPEPPAGANPPS